MFSPTHPPPSWQGVSSQNSAENAQLAMNFGGFKFAGGREMAQPSMAQGFGGYSYPTGNMTPWGCNNMAGLSGLQRGAYGKEETTAGKLPDPMHGVFTCCLH